MDNGNMPAMPNSNTETYPTPCAIGWGAGLTKREHFAGLAMQGFITAGVNGMPSASEIALLSISYADTLLRGLDNVE